MALPTVVVGLVVALVLFRGGPLGSLDLIYTVRGMIIAQVLIAAPLITGITMAAIRALPEELPDQLRALGANRRQLVVRLWLEARLPLLAAVMAGFGHAVSEVGAVTMVGGNIHGQTQVLTTAIVEDVGRGDFRPALAYGAVLLALAFAVNAVAHLRAAARSRVGAVLNVAGVRHRRGGREVLRVDRLSVAAGERLGLLGLNGAGKTSLLRLLAAIDEPTVGEVRVDDVPTSQGGPALRRRLAYAPQRPVLLSTTVRHNVELPLRYRRVPRPTRQKVAAAALARLGVEHLADRPARALSGGEAQRVSLARALACEPDALLLDEPAAGLDTPTRAGVLRRRRACPRLPRNNGRPRLPPRRGGPRPRRSHRRPRRGRVTPGRPRR